jgi:hypothetical protein
LLRFSLFLHHKAFWVCGCRVKIKIITLIFAVKKLTNSSSTSGDAGPIQPGVRKNFGIPEGNFTINIELYRQNFTCVELLGYKNISPISHMNFLDDDHRTSKC